MTHSLSVQAFLFFVHTDLPVGRGHSDQQICICKSILHWMDQGLKATQESLGNSWQSFIFEFTLAHSGSKITCDVHFV